MSGLEEFTSKLRGHALQREEIHLIADMIIIFFAVKGRMPTRAEIKQIWSDYER